MRENLEELKEFTEDEIKRRDLIIDMLRYEDSLMLGEVGKQIYGDDTLNHLTSLETFYLFHRMTLNKFNYMTRDKDVSNYRKIFSKYYKNASDYDKEVLDSVCYMRENRCVYYTEPKINIGDNIPNCDLYELDGESKMTLYDLIKSNKHQYIFIGAYSNS